MRRYYLWLLCLLAALGLAVGLACSSSDDDDDDSTADDDSTDDDTADDDTADDDDADDDSAADDDSTDDDTATDDDATPEGPAPLLDNFIILPAEGYAGDSVTLTIHWLDNEGDVQGGTVELFVDGESAAVFPANTAGEFDGFIDLAYLLPDNIPEGLLLFEVTVTDEAGNVSNKLGADFDSHGLNHDPTISNLRFDPNPACNQAGTTFDVIFDFEDEDANLSGGLVNIIVDNTFPPLTAQITGEIPASGTIYLTMPPLSGAPPSDPYKLNIKVQLADNAGGMSEIIEADETLSGSACK